MPLNPQISLALPLTRPRLLELSDEDLARQFSLGNFEAFEALVERHSQALFNYIYHLVDDADEANDVLQQVLVKAHAALPRLDTFHAIKPWLFKVARNQSLDLLRQRRQKHRPASFASLSRLKNHENNQSDEAWTEQIHDPTAQPEEIAEQHDLQALLKIAMTHLPERYRAVVELRYNSDMSFAEIGKTLGIPENTAKTFFQRAKAILREYLKDKL